MLVPLRPSSISAKAELGFFLSSSMVLVSQTKVNLKKKSSAIAEIDDGPNGTSTLYWILATYVLFTTTNFHGMCLWIGKSWALL